MLKYKVLKHSMVGLKGSIVELPNDSQTEQRIELGFIAEISDVVATEDSPEIQFTQPSVETKVIVNMETKVKTPAKRRVKNTRSKK